MGPYEKSSLIIAVYAAIVSSMLALVQIVSTVRGQTRRLRLTCCPGIAVDGSGRLRDDLILIKAVNAGRRPITIVGSGFILSDGRQVIDLDNQGWSSDLPKTVNDGEMADFRFPMSALTHRLVTERHRLGVTNLNLRYAFVRDAEGHDHRTKVPRFLGDV